MDSQKLFKGINGALEKSGFFIVENYLKQPDVEAVKSILEIEIGNEDDTRPYDGFDRCHIHDLLVRYPELLKLLDDPALDDAIASVLGKHWVLYAATSSSIPPRDTNYASRIHVDSPRLVLNYPFNIGVIWTLSDYTKENGCLEVVPGSHRHETAPTLEEFEKHKIKIFCKSGALIVFNARLYHRTTANLSNCWRHAMTMNTCRSFMKQRFDWVRFIGGETVAEYSDRVRRILGYDTRVPANMEEFCQPEHLRFYKSNQD